MAPNTPISEGDLENRFKYHRPDNEKGNKHEQVREACLELAKELVMLVPPGREASLMVTHLEETMMWANAGIARS